MKKFILTILTILIFTWLAQAEYFSDVIVTSPNAIWTDSRAYGTLNAAITAVGANDRTILVASPQIVTSLTIPSNITIQFERDGSITNSGQLTIQTTNLDAPSRQIFTGTGDIDFANGTIVKTSWFSDFVESVDQTTDDYITLLITESAYVDADTTLGNNVTLRSDAYGNNIVSNAGFTLDNIGQVIAGDYQVFAGSGDFDFRDGVNLNLSWFNRLRSALDWIESEGIEINVYYPSTVDYDATIPSNVSLNIHNGGTLTISPGVTLQTAPPRAGIYQIFTGTGTVKIDGPVYPQWWGGYGDASTHVEDAFQSAIDASQGAQGEGSKVIVPHGVYYFYDEVILRDDVTIEGQGMPEFYMQTANKDLFVTGAVESEMTFRNIKFVGLGSDYDGTIDEAAIALISSDIFVLIENCVFQQNEVGVSLGTAGVSVTIKNSDFKYFSHAGIWTKRPFYVNAIGNRFNGDRAGIGDAEDGHVGIWISGPSSSDAGRQSIIQGNRVTNTYNEGIICRSEQVIVTDNSVSNATNGSGGSYGIIVEGSIGAVDLGAGVQVNVSNNLVYNSDGGIAVRHDVGNTSTSPHEVIISNNIVKGITDAYGIQVGHATSGNVELNILVIGNVVQDISSIGISAGNIAQSMITGNLIENALVGISVFGHSAPDTVYEVVISNNYINNSDEDGITYNGLTGYIINNIIIDPNTTDAASQYGIDLNTYTSGGVLRNNYVDAGSHVDYCYKVRGTNIGIGGNGCSDYNTASMDTDTETAAHVEDSNCTIAYEEPTSFDTTSGAIAATLSDGFHIGQLKSFVMTTDGGFSVTLTITHHETSDPEVYTFGDVDDTLILMWTGAEWITIYNGSV